MTDIPILIWNKLDNDDWGQSTSALTKGLHDKFSASQKTRTIVKNCNSVVLVAMSGTHVLP